MDIDLLQKAYKAACAGRSYAVATIVESTVKGTPRKAGAKMIVLDDGSLFGTIGGGRNEKAAREECLKSIKSRNPCIATYNYFGHKGESICGGQMKVFIEPFIGQRKLIICGAGHIALPLSFLAKLLNFHVTIIDSRREFANKKRFNHVDKIIKDNHAIALEKLSIDQQTFIMIVTHGNEYDFECLEKIIKTNAAYIGVISSHTKKIKFFNRLKKINIEQKFLKKIKIPAGIDIGAQTPEEIAISIFAEIIGTSNIKNLNTRKFREKSKN